MNTALPLAVESKPRRPNARREQITVDWSRPPVRSGMPGVWDRFVGPGATRAENLLQSVVPVVAGVAAAANPLAAQLAWPWWKALVAGLLAADLAGGVVTNATNTAKRWYHRGGQTAWHHLAFVAVHIVQVALVGVLFRSHDWTFVAITYGAAVTGSAAISFAPAYLQRPIATTLYMLLLVASTYFIPATPGLEWFLPVFFLKLLVAHLPIEAPLASPAETRSDA